MPSEELPEMFNCVSCQKKMIVKFLVSIINLKSKDIENSLHISKSVVSRHMTGERNRPEIDIFIIEKVFGIKIKDYSVCTLKDAAKQVSKSKAR